MQVGATDARVGKQRNRSRWAARALGGLFALALLAVHAATAGANGATIPPGNLTANSSFELNLNGWAAVGSLMSRVPRSDAPHRGYVALLDKEPGVSSYRIRDEPPTVNSSVAGASYRAEAWVRRAALEAEGKQIGLYIRERTPGGVTVGTAYTKIALSSTFDSLSTTYVAQGNGNEIDTYLRRPATSSGTLVSGEKFYADAYSLIQSLTPQGPIRVVGSTESLRPDEPMPPGAGTEAHLVAARNEFESFQIAIDATGAPINQLTVGLSGPLSGPGGATIPTSNVTIYRAHPYQVSTRSDGEGDTGKWPDALIPERDYLYGQDRSAFPVNVATGDRVIGWVDVLVPNGAPPGEYAGILQVNSSGGSLGAIPILLDVRDFVLPSTASLTSAFFIRPNSDQPCLAHFGSACNASSDSSWQLHYLYARAALENRFSIANPDPVPYADPPATAKFQQYVQPLLDGGATVPVPGVAAPRLSGQRLTAISGHWWCAENPGCLSAWRTLANNLGFADRFSEYLCDEPPNGSNWVDCNANADSTDQEWPGAPRLVTAPISAAQQADQQGLIDLQDDIDVLNPIIQQIADKPGQPLAGNQRPSYNGFLNPANNGAGTAPNSLWLYTSCTSYSCNASESAYQDGWPGYAIDQPPFGARAMGWLAYIYDSSGELYWNTTQHLNTAWSNQYDFGNNGDGTLFYPGLPNGNGSGAVAIGGQSPIPIESLRLKRLRDGREDFEYLSKLKACGHTAEATDVARVLFQKGATTQLLNEATFSTTGVTEQEITQARSDLADLIEQYGC